MNKNTKILLTVIGFFLLVGCGSTPIGPIYSEAPKPPLASDQYSILHVYRTGAFIFGTAVLIDDEKILSIPKDSYSWFKVKPGIHHFEINASMGAPVVHFDEEIKPVKEYYLWLGVSGAKVSASFEDKDRAMEIIKTLKYAKPLTTEINTSIK